MARYIAEQRRPEILKAFALNRFCENRLLGETANPPGYGPWN